MVLGVVGAVDRYVSHAVFNLHLPYPLEVLLSIPGTWFGMPFTALLIVPLLLSVLECQSIPSSAATCGGSSAHPEAASALVFGLSGAQVVLVLAASLVFAWVVACHESSSRGTFDHDIKACYGTSRFLFPFGTGRAQILLGTLIFPFYGGLAAFFYLIQVSSEQQVVLAYYVSYFLTQIVIQIVKTWASRERPVHGSAYLAAHPRHLHQIRFLTLQPSTRFESFPSGDAAGAGVALYFFHTILQQHPLHGPGTDSVLPAFVIALAVLSCVGRMYYHCHHLLDVVVGVSTGYYLSSFVDARAGSIVSIRTAALTQFALTGLIAWTHMRKKKAAAVAKKLEEDLNQDGAVLASSGGEDTTE